MNLVEYVQRFLDQDAYINAESILRQMDRFPSSDYAKLSDSMKTALSYSIYPYYVMDWRNHVRAIAQLVLWKLAEANSSTAIKYLFPVPANYPSMSEAIGNLFTWSNIFLMENASKGLTALLRQLPLLQRYMTEEQKGALISSLYLVCLHTSSHQSETDFTIAVQALATLGTSYAHDCLLALKKNGYVCESKHMSHALHSALETVAWKVQQS